MGEKVHLSLGTDFAEVSDTNPLPVKALSAAGAVSESNPLFVKLQNANGATYHAFGTGYTAYATPTDMLVLKGSATKIVRVQSFILFAQSTAAALSNVDFIKRSAANTGGTASQPTINKLDSADGAATAVLDLYSVIPASLGAGVTLYRQTSLTGATTAPPVGFTLASGFNPNGISLIKPVTLRGVAESLAINWGGAALPAGFTAHWQATWTESDI